MSSPERIEKLRAFAPDDPAWAAFVPALAAADDARRSLTIPVQGYEPKPKRRIDLAGDLRVFDALVDLAVYWPGRPMGRTAGAVKSRLYATTEDYAGT